MSSQRDSSVELFRILATFSVLIAHWNGWFVGGIPDFDFSAPSFYRCGQLLIGALCSICVNCFLVISGYFGIKLKLRSLLNFFFILVGIYLPFYLISVLLGEPFSAKTLLTRFLPVTIGGYFVQCYFMLMFLSPVLNAFLDRFGKKTLGWVLLFLLIEFWFDCVHRVDNFGFNEGYSFIHFVLMYLLAAEVRLYKEDLFRVKKGYWILGYGLCTLIIVGMFMSRIPWTFAYSNPVIIISSFCLFIPFLYRSFKSNAINYIAKSTFAVYIIQVTEPVFSIIKKTDLFLLENYPYPLYLLLSLFVLLVFFFACIGYDKVRAWCMNPLLERINSFVQNKRWFTFLEDLR